MSYVVFTEHLKSDGTFLAEVKLNRPRSLNALNLEMILELIAQLNKWKNNPRLSAVFLHGEGERAFCVGGDVKSIYSGIIPIQQNKKEIQKKYQPFFESEYRLDYLLHTYPCPVVVWGHGFVIGGGAGLFLASSHKIVTSRFLLSMPEISIGLFPDVGVSYLFSRLPSKIGWYLSLTAYQLNSVEALFLNLADFYFEDSQKDQVFKTLLTSHFKTKSELNLILKSIKVKDKLLCVQQNWIQKYQDQINFVCKSQKIKTIAQNFTHSSLVKGDKKWEQNRQVFLKASPISLAISHALLNKALLCNLKQVFKINLVLMLNCAYSSNFLEGVKALLVDKTKNPKWVPQSIEKVTEAQIKEYFKPSKDWINPLEDLSL